VDYFYDLLFFLLEPLLCEAYFKLVPLRKLKADGDILLVLGLCLGLVLVLVLVLFLVGLPFPLLCFLVCFFLGFFLNNAFIYNMIILKNKRINNYIIIY